MEICNLSFKEALKKIHDILNLKFVIKLDNTQSNNYNPLEIFENIRKKSNTNTKENYELKFYDESILDQSHYIKLPYIGFVREGILPQVQEEFNVMYDTERNRILFPHRYWSNGELLGIFGRTANKYYDILRIPKYYGVLPYPKSLNLYGLYENYKSIQEQGYVIVFEGEKSVLKAKSYGYPVGVSLGGHQLSQEQTRILIGLDVDIIFALDKDVNEEVSVNMCNEFKGIRNAYYIYDKYGLLGKKDAPIDKGYKIFKYLLKYRKKVV